MTDKKATIRRNRFAAIIICVLVIVGLIAGNRLYDQIQLARLLNRLDIVVSQINSGALKPDKSGDITLPPQFAGLSKSGRVYCTYDAVDPPALFFPTEVSDDQKAGYVYCESPPSKDRWGHRWLSFREAQSLMLFQLDAPTSFRTAHPHWFRAEPFYS